MQQLDNSDFEIVSILQTQIDAGVIETKQPKQIKQKTGYKHY